MISGSDKRFRNLEKKVGLFVIAAIIGIAGVVFFIAEESDIFRPTFMIKLTAPKGTGFSQGMPIKLSGFRIGRVKIITLNEAASVDVVLQIDRRYHKWIRTDSVARLIKEGMIGDYIVEIGGGTQAELIPENGVIELGKTKAIDELADEIAEKVKPVLKDVREIIAYINSPDGDIKQSLANLNRFSANIEGTRRNADALLADTRRTIEKSSASFDLLLARAGERMDQTGPVLQKADNSLKQIDDRLPVLLGNLDKSLTNLESVSTQLSSTSTATLPHVPRLVEKTEGVLDQGGDLLDSTRNIWPFTSVMPQQRQTLIKGSGRD